MVLKHSPVSKRRTKFVQVRCFEVVNQKKNLNHLWRINHVCCKLVHVHVNSLQLLNFKRLKLHFWYAYSTNDSPSNDTKIDGLVTLTVTFMLVITFSVFCHRGHNYYLKVQVKLYIIIYRSKTRQRATLLLLTWIYFCRSGGTVNFTLPFMTNVTISISTSQIFRSWVAIFQPRPPMTSLFRSSYGMPGLAPRMDVLSWGLRDF